MIRLEPRTDPSQTMIILTPILADYADKGFISTIIFIGIFFPTHAATKA